MHYYLYIIKNSVGELYIGVTENPEKRVTTHNQNMGAYFTKNKLDFKIVFLEEYLTLVEARQREIQLKKWRREKKEMLIERYEKGFATKQ